VASEVLVGIAIDCARLVVAHGLPEAAQFLSLAEEFQPDDRYPVEWQSRIEAVAQVVREMDASEISLRSKCATLAAHSAACAAGESWGANEEALRTRACEAVGYTSHAAGDSHDAVLEIVRKGLPWSVMVGQLEGLWGDEE
jgi:hypothetical protein